MIEIKDISKTYHSVKKSQGISGAIKGLFKKETTLIPAVDHLSFNIGDGEMVGFIGPNGAGKSTAIKMMCGILTPTEGEILFDGINITKHRKEVVQNIGVVFGQRTQLNWDLRLGESFELLRRIYRIEKTQYQRTLRELDEILGINELIDKPVRQMSLGQRMRGDLAAAMLHSPKVLFLDEPTIGLDVESKYALRRFVKSINEQRGTTVLLTTHDLGDIEQLCRRIIIINRGRLMEDGDLAQIVERIAPYRTLKVEYYDESCPTHERCELISHSSNIAEYRFRKSEITAAALIAELSQHAPIRDLSIEEAGIDDIIRIAYGQSSADTACV